MNRILNLTVVRQAMKYALVGVLNSLVGTGVYLLVLNVFGLDYRIANIISYMVGVTHSFLWTKFWVFPGSNRGKREVFCFLMIFLISFAIQNLTLVFLVESFHWSKFWAYLAAMAVYPLISFFGNKWVTFRA